MNFLANTISNIISNNSGQLLYEIGRKNKCEIVMTSNNYGYQKLHKIIRNLNKKKYDEHRLFNKGGYSYLTPGSEYTIKLRGGNFMKITQFPLNEKAINVLTTTVSIYGKDKKIIRNKIITKIEEFLGFDKILVKDTSDYCPDFSINKKAFDNIVLYPKVKEEIITGISNWYVSKDWYKNHQLIHKLGILLYGEPGCGKSSIIRAISTLLNNAQLIIIDQSSINRSENIFDSILQKREEVSGPIIVIFEDFDLMVYNRDDDKIDSDRLKIQGFQNKIMQILDGIYSTEDTIFIATTNHIEKIDKALIRAGRFDIQEEILPFDYPRVMEFLKLFDKGEEFYKENIEGKYQLPIQPAKLQSIIMEDRAKELIKNYVK